MTTEVLGLKKCSTNFVHINYISVQAKPENLATSYKYPDDMHSKDTMYTQASVNESPT